MSKIEQVIREVRCERYGNRGVMVLIENDISNLIKISLVEDIDFTTVVNKNTQTEFMALGRTLEEALEAFVLLFDYDSILCSFHFPIYDNDGFIDDIFNHTQLVVFN
jgi:hypothetical protein